MYSFDSRIRYSETDSEGRLTLSALLDYFQDSSTFQAHDVGAGVSFMKQRGLVWVLNSWQIVPIRFPMFGEHVTIGTFPYEFRKFIGQRNFLMLDDNGEYLAMANSMWSLISIDTGKPVNAPQEILVGYRVEEKLPMEYAQRKIPVREGGTFLENIPVTRRLLDVNHHVNNGQYVRLAEDFWPDGVTVKQLRAEYKKQAFLGDVLHPYVTNENGIFTTIFRDAEGQTYASVEIEYHEK